MDPEVPSLMGGGCEVDVSLGKTTVAFAEALTAEFACEIAVMVRVFAPAPGKLAGAVYTPPALMVPTVGFPFTTPFTLQFTGAPVPDAVYVCVLFSAMVVPDGETLSVSGAVTVKLAEAMLPGPPLVELAAPVVLVKVPPDVPVTFNVIVQVAPKASAPPLSEMIVLPATAVAVPAQPFVNPGVGATAKPEGSVSKNATPDSLTVFAAGLVMVKVRLVVPFSAMPAAPKASAIEGGAATAIVAEALLPVPPSVDATLPVVLIGAPAAVPVTFSENVHEVFAARLAPLRLIRLVA